MEQTARTIRSARNTSRRALLKTAAAFGAGLGLAFTAGAPGDAREAERGDDHGHHGKHHHHHEHHHHEGHHHGKHHH